MLLKQTKTLQLIQNNKQPLTIFNLKKVVFILNYQLRPFRFKTIQLMDPI